MKSPSPMLVLGLTLLIGASALCPNSCSGHGSCNLDETCSCYQNFESPDCSLRTCPFAFEFTGTPTAHNDAHYYAECANAGVCDRTTGVCQCFPGYEGKGCARRTCPNDCSGNGVCRLIEDLNPDVTYASWDAGKSQACVCDAGFSGPDCSFRMCARGDDPLTTVESVSQKHFLSMAVAKATGLSTAEAVVNVDTLTTSGPMAGALKAGDLIIVGDSAPIVVSDVSEPSTVEFGDDVNFAAGASISVVEALVESTFSVTGGGDLLLVGGAPIEDTRLRLGDFVRVGEGTQPVEVTGFNIGFDAGGQQFGMALANINGFVPIVVGTEDAEPVFAVGDTMMDNGVFIAVTDFVGLGPSTTGNCAGVGSGDEITVPDTFPLSAGMVIDIDGVFYVVDSTDTATVVADSFALTLSGQNLPPVGVDVCTVTIPAFVQIDAADEPPSIDELAATFAKPSVVEVDGEVSGEDVEVKIVAPPTDGSFFITYTDPYGGVWNTSSIVAPITVDAASAASTAAAIQSALRSLPNKVLLNVTVAGYAPDDARIVNPDGTISDPIASEVNLRYVVTFANEPGTSGEQQQLVVNSLTTAAGSQPANVGFPGDWHLVVSQGVEGTAGVAAAALSELAECSNRGVCNGELGECVCFAGFKGLACQLQDALI